MKTSKWELAILALFFCGMGSLTGFLLWQKGKGGGAPTVEPWETSTVPTCERREKLTDLCLAADATGFYYSVMIENHGDARPVSGLADARLVYETVAEAPITRFLAIFYSGDEIEEIGPVRSARLYYVNWAREFSGPYAHVGGSPESLEILKKQYPFDLNEFFSAKYFWRDKIRLAPHNSYTSSELIATAVEKYDWNVKAQDFGVWSFKDDAPLNDLPSTHTVHVDFAAAGYNVDWHYDSQMNEYVRYVAGQRDITRAGEELRAKNIAVMYTSSEVIDDEGRRDTRVLGSGEAAIYLDGQELAGVWRRDKVNERTRFFNQAGEEIYFNRGVTWIEVVPEHFARVSMSSAQ